MFQEPVESHELASVEGGKEAEDIAAADRGSGDRLSGSRGRSTNPLRQLGRATQGQRQFSAREARGFDQRLSARGGSLNPEAVKRSPRTPIGMNTPFVSR